MGLFGDMLKGVRMQDPVRGHAQVVSCTSHHGEGFYQNCHMQLVVQAPGVPATSVEEHDLVRHDRWPFPGMTLPVTVDRANPQKVKIEWDEVESSKDRSKRSADAIAAAMRGEAPPAGAGPAGLGGGPFGGNFQVVNASGRDLSQLSEEQKAKLRMLGIDPAMLAAQQGPTAPPGAGAAPPPGAGAAPPGAHPAPPPPPPGAPMASNPGAGPDDQLARLERLAALRQQGILNEAEFEQQKKRILGS
jgi:hypothetical protein